MYADIKKIQTEVKGQQPTLLEVAVCQNPGSRTVWFQAIEPNITTKTPCVWSGGPLWPTQDRRTEVTTPQSLYCMQFFWGYHWGTLGIRSRSCVYNVTIATRYWSSTLSLMHLLLASSVEPPNCSLLSEETCSVCLQSAQHIACTFRPKQTDRCFAWLQRGCGELVFPHTGSLRADVFSLAKSIWVEAVCPRKKPTVWAWHIDQLASAAALF